MDPLFRLQWKVDKQGTTQTDISVGACAAAVLIVAILPWVGQSVHPDGIHPFAASHLLWVAGGALITAWSLFAKRRAAKVCLSVLRSVLAQLEESAKGADTDLTRT